MQPVHDLVWLNSLNAEEAAKAFLKCCGSTRWAGLMSNDRPYTTLEDVVKHAGQIWFSLTAADWLEAFRSHPKIGEKKASQDVAAQSQRWSSQEQSGVTESTPETIDSLATLNRAYEEKFGFIFIICATGKTAGEMLEALKERLQHNYDTELPLAAAEQGKITELRLKKLLTST